MRLRVSHHIPQLIFHLTQIKCFSYHFQHCYKTEPLLELYTKNHDPVVFSFRCLICLNHNVLLSENLRVEMFILFLTNINYMSAIMHIIGFLVSRAWFTYRRSKFSVLI